MAPIVTQFARIYPERNAEEPTGVFGTSPAVPTYKDLRILTDDIDGGPSLTAEYDASNAFGLSGVDDAGSRYSGGITSKTRVDELTLLYLAFFGKVVTTGSGPSYTHVYTPLDDLTATAPSLGLDLGIEKKRMYKFSGVLVNQINISKVNAGEVNHSYDIIAKSRTTDTYPTAYAPTYSALNKLQTVLTATLHGQAITWESLTIQMTRNWDTTLAFGVRTVPDAEIGLFTCEIDGVVKFENSNPIFVDAFEAGTEGELTLTFRGDVITGSIYQTLMLEFDRVKIMNTSPPHINADRKTQSVKLQVLVPTSGDWAKASIINSVSTPASYP